MATNQKNRSPLSLAIFILGFSAITAQVLFMRELSVVFYGNELSLGVILGNWLLWTALGSGVLGKLAGRIRSPIRCIAIIQLVLALVVPLSLFAVRASKLFVQRTPGEIIGFVPMLTISFFAVSLFCILSGFLFALTSHAVHSSRKLETGEGRGKDSPPSSVPNHRLRASSLSLSVGRVYLIEALGAGVGGLIFSFLLIPYLQTFHIAFLVSGLNILSAVLFIRPPVHKRFNVPMFQRSNVLHWIIGGLGIPLFIVGIGKAAPLLERLSNQLLWRGYTLIHAENTRYGHLAVIRRGDQISLFENGLLMLTVPDRFYAEESVHFALLEHPHPENVLLIGGSLGGRLAEILRHPSIQRVDVVELDPKVIELGRTYFPEMQRRVLNNPKVHLHYMDGRRFVKEASRRLPSRPGPPLRYDVLLINLPDPFTTQINRFYTVEFYKEAKAILSPDGVLAFTVTSSENYISDELSDFLSTLYRTLCAVFPDVIVLPGNTNPFIACAETNILTTDPLRLIQRLQERGIQTQYLGPYLPYRIAPDRQHYLRSRVALSAHVCINRDFQPIGYYYDMVLWSTYFSSTFRAFLNRIKDIQWSTLALLSGGIVVIMFLLTFVRPQVIARRTALVLTVAVVGGSELTVEVIALLSFQALYGYIYHQLALIVAAYMIGLTFGGWYAVRSLPTMSFPERALIIIQAVILVLPVGMLLVLKALSNAPALGVIAFPLCTFVAGLVGGVQFPIANALYMNAQGGGHAAVGTLYATDLIGSCLGALTASAFLLPLLGIPQACIVLLLFNGAALISLLVVYVQVQSNHGSHADKYPVL